MRAAVFEAPGRIDVHDADPAALGEAGVRVRVDMVGVCGSDVTTFYTGAYVHPGQVMGHEIVGTVVEAGPRSLVQAGALVSVRPMRCCGACWYCLRGDIHLCGHTGELSLSFGLPGAFADEVVAPDGDDPASVIALSPDTAIEDAVWIEPLAVTVHALGRARVGGGQEIAVIGAGPLGICTVAAARAMGITAHVIEPREQRRALALACGAATAAAPEEAGSRAGCFAAVIDTSGSAAGFATAAKLAVAGGVVVLVGLSSADVSLPAGIRVLGSFGYLEDDFVRAARLVDDGLVRLGAAVTHAFPLERVGDAIRAARHDPTAGKVVIQPASST